LKVVYTIFCCASTKDLYGKIGKDYILALSST